MVNEVWVVGSILPSLVWSCTVSSLLLTAHNPAVLTLRRKLTSSSVPKKISCTSWKNLLSLFCFFVTTNFIIIAFSCSWVVLAQLVDAKNLSKANRLLLDLWSDFFPFSSSGQESCSDPVWTNTMALWRCPQQAKGGMAPSSVDGCESKEASLRPGTHAGLFSKGTSFIISKMKMKSSHW